MPASSFRRALVVLCFALLAITPGARAQEDDGPMMQAGPFAMPYSARSLASLVRIVGMDKDQTGAARELHQGYRAAFGGATKKVRKQQEEINKKAQETGDWSKYSKDAGALTLGYIDETRKLEAGLMEDLKSLCTPAQAARFGAAERARRRDVGLMIALGHGERIDLVSMFEGLKIDRKATPALDDLVTHWESDVDRLLVEKDRTVREGMKEIMGAGGGPESMEKVKKFSEALATVCMRIGETNRRAATEAQGLIPEGSRDGFAMEVKERSFPRIYGGSTVTRALKSALDMKDLSGEQKTKLKELGEAYKQEAAPINARWATASEEKQRQMVTRFMEMMQDRGPKDESDPFYAARKERKNLDEKYQEKIAGVLTAEQKDQLPKAEHSHGDIPEFLPDFEADFKGEWDRWKEEGR